MAFSQGAEGFNGFREKSSGFYSGSFVGENGINWNFTQCRSNLTISKDGFEKSGIILKSDTTAEIFSSVISGGIGLLKIDFTSLPFTVLKFDIFVNSIKVATLNTSILENVISLSTGNIVVNIDKPFYIRIKQSDQTAGQVVIEKVSWSKFSSEDFGTLANAHVLTKYNDTGLLKEHLSTIYHLFPNPAKEYVFIEMSEYHNVLFKLFTLTGQMVLQEQVKGTGQKINISNLKEGLYLYKILDDKGKLITGKMIIR